MSCKHCKLKKHNQEAERQVRAEAPSCLHPQECRLGHQPGTSGSTIDCEAAAIHSLRSCVKAQTVRKKLWADLDDAKTKGQLNDI